MWPSFFFKGSCNLKNFDIYWLLTDIDFCKPKVIQDLSLNFNLFLETFFRGTEMSSKDWNFSIKVLYDVSVFDESKRLSQSTKNNQEKIFSNFDQSLSYLLFLGQEDIKKYKELQEIVEGSLIKKLLS